MEGMKALSSALKTTTTLKCLNADGSTFGDEGASHLAEALSHTSLQVIKVAFCNIGERGMVALSLALEGNTTLTHFDIFRNNSRDEGIIALSSALSINTTLTHLKISLWNISGRSRVALARAILQNTTLTSLKGMRELKSQPAMFTCEVTQELMKDPNTFYTGIKKSPFVQCISIERTSRLGEAMWSGNMEKAVEILQLNLPPAVVKTLKVHLSNNTWEVDYGARKVHETDDGLLKIRSIYNDHRSWSSLRELSLHNMFLGGVGACLLAEMLNEMQIWKLDVTHCHIPEDGIVALSQALSTNTTLKYLAIGGNRINKCGRVALTRALTENKTLTVLDISMHKTSESELDCFLLHQRDKAFESSEYLMFFQSIDQFSLSTIVTDYLISLKENCASFRAKVMDLRTYKSYSGL